MTVKSADLASARWTLCAMALAAGLVACGGSDDDTPAPVEPPVQPSNLADCHNPSMYTPGSSWSVTFDSGNVNSIVVHAPRAEWELPEGIVRWAVPTQAGADAGVYYRVRNGTVETLLLVNWFYFSSGPAISYEGYVPGLAAPIALANGQTYRTPPTKVYNVLYSQERDENGWLPPRKPLLDGEGELRDVTDLGQTTYIGRETITVPAGTFETCHTTRTSNFSGETHHWTVAEGPYKGLSVMTEWSTASGASRAAATVITADWK